MGDEIRTVRTLVCGENGVGKSAICNRLVHNIFVDLDPTYEDSYRRKLSINNEEYLIDVNDMATLEVDSEYYWAGNSRTYQYNDGIILVYSISNRKSFEELKKWKENIVQLKQRSHGEDVKFPFFIVGNKCDLEESRVVSTEEGEQAAAEFGFPFFETSAKSGMNIQELFIEFVKCRLQFEIVVKNIVKKKPKKNCHLM